MDRQEMIANFDEPACPWSFELVDGKLVIHMDACELSEKTFQLLDIAREAFMEPVWKARREAADKASGERYRIEHNIKSHIEVIEGVEVRVSTQGPNDEVTGARVGDEEKPRIQTCRVYTRGESKSWNAEFRHDRWKTNYPYEPLRNKKGGAIAFRTPQAAIRAALLWEKLNQP